MTDKIIATLTHGMYYDYNGKVWNNHTSGDSKASHEVTPEEKEYLSEHAVEREEVNGKEYLTPRFSFSDDEVAKPSVRQRRKASE